MINCKTSCTWQSRTESFWVNIRDQRHSFYHRLVLPYYSCNIARDVYILYETRGTQEYSMGQYILLHAKMWISMDL